MAVEAPLSKYKKDNYRIAIGVFLLLAIVFAYDGYLSRYEWSKRHSFYQEHVLDNDGKPDGTMLFNQRVPPVFVVAAVICAVRLGMIKGRKITAGDDALILADGSSIPYERIEQIDKTLFDSKGSFVISYKNSGGGESNLKLESRAYDNLASVLDVLTAKLTGQSA